ncbi:CHAT domain-containing tetratricopeptide repeat protein [Nonomuraea dietziae]|uniref:CHAT domain-containing tetratricopeptide repeat protein n=1 Tax=Nonomuraea dietziae TaxID=65515 RepID=UPI0033CFD183
MDGLLTAIRLDAHRKQDVPAVETITPVAGGRLAAGSLTPELVDTVSAPDAEEARLISAIQMVQRLEAGERTLTQLQLVGIGHQAGRLVTMLTLDFVLTDSVDWGIAVDSVPVTGAPDADLRLACGQNVYLKVTAPVPATFDDGVVRVRLPAGESRLSLIVVSNPDLPIADTIVVCRPDQIREAAIVASCLPADRFTPIVTVTAPPIAMKEFDELTTRQEAASQAAMELIGGSLGLREVLAGERGSRTAVLDGLTASASLRHALAPQASWFRRHEKIAALVAAAGVRRAVLLFDPDDADLDVIGAAARLHLLPGYPGASGAGRVFYRDLDELARLAWSHLANADADTDPTAWVEAPADKRAAWVPALFMARRAGLPLRPGPGTGLRELLAETNSRIATDEAVLVEVSGEADELLAALYAHHRGARLVTVPPPDLTPVRETVAAHQESVLRGSGRRFTGIEAAVTAQVPRNAVADVGDRRLTAFTYGLPYSFVRDGEVDWSTKPIGHVIGDPLLILLAELGAAGSPRDPVTFSLIFDPGFFTTSETADVVDSLSGHHTHPLILDDDEASTVALVSLPKILPVELIFFNTHGNDESILLADIALPGTHIPALVSLATTPIVFNNSCESWTGVGKEFVRSGARGYIGSLWSVPSNLAAKFARRVMRQLAMEAIPVAEAMVRTQLPAQITRSYLFVGTANAKLDQWGGRPAEPGQDAIAACTSLQLAAQDCPSALSHLFLRELVRHLDAVEGTPYGSTTACGDALIAALILTNTLPVLQAADLDRADRLAGRLDDLLNRLEISDRSRAGHRALNLSLSGDRHRARGEFDAALAAYEQALSYGEACPDPAMLHLNAAEILSDRGQYARALDHANQGYDACAADGDEEGLLTAIGTLGQLHGRMGRHDQALRYVREGHALAVRTGDVRRQRLFKADESIAALRLGDAESARSAAEETLRLARGALDERGELKGYGLLGQALLAAGALDEAERRIRSGLERARELSDPVEEAAFTYDLGLVLSRRGQHGRAAIEFANALALYGENERWADCANLLWHLADSATRARDIDRLWLVVTDALNVFVVADVEVFSGLLDPVVEAFQQVCVHGTRREIRRRTAELIQIGGQIEEPRPPEVDFLAYLAALVEHRLWGDAAGAMAAARQLDEQTDSRYAMAAFLTRLPAQRGWLRGRL